METLASVASDFVNGVIHYPFMSGGIFVAWGLLVGVGVLACRIRIADGWIFEWLVWAYVCTGLSLEILADGTRIAEPYGPVMEPLTDFLWNGAVAIGIGLHWPVVLGDVLYEATPAARSGGDVLFFVAIGVITMTVGALAALVITLATRGVPGRPHSHAAPAGES